MAAQIKKWAKTIKKQLFLLYLACRDARVPVSARIFAGCVVAYAFSPVDLIPDFIPVFGYLDDVLLVPAGIWLSLKMIPKHVASELAEKAAELAKAGKKPNWAAGAMILFVWGWAAWYAFQFAAPFFAL